MENSNSAKPFLNEIIQEGHQSDIILTKRERISAIAMVALTPPTDYFGEEETNKAYEVWAKKCVKMADELLKQLETKTT